MTPRHSFLRAVLAGFLWMGWGFHTSAAAESLVLVLREGNLIHGDLARAGTRIFKVTRGDLPAIAPVEDLRSLWKSPWFLHGSAAAFGCPPPDEIPSKTNWMEVLSASRLLEREEALEGISRVAAGLACGGLSVSPVDMGRIREEEGRFMTRVSATTVLLTVFAPPNTEALWIDGVRQEGREQAEVWVTPGMHIVQLARKGDVEGIALACGDGRVVLADGERAYRAVRDRAVKAPEWLAGLALLETASRRWVADRIYLVGPGRRGAVWAWDPLTRELTQVARGAVPVFEETGP